MAKAVFFLGSESDKSHAEKISTKLERWGISVSLHVSSAHKVPEKLLELIKRYDNEKNIVFITIAGRSNGISGVTAGATHHPVIACPPFKDKADYLTNIHSSLQMPSHTPYAVVLDPTNASELALRILAVGDSGLSKIAKEVINDVKSSYV